MGRIDDLMKKGNGVNGVSCAGLFPTTEAERLNSAWRHSGAKNRADFIYNATMDAVEKVEQAKGGIDALAKIEAARLTKIEESAKKKQAAQSSPGAKK